MTESIYTTIKDPTKIVWGYLVIISVEAIRERTAERWWSKRDAVWAFAERQFKKDFTKADAIKRLNDVEYLLTQAGGRAALRKAAQLLKATVTMFLGVSSPSQLKVRIVRAIKDGVIEATPLTLAELKALDDPAIGGVAETASDQTKHPPNHLRFSIHADASYDVSIRLKPIWNIYREAVSSYVISLEIFANQRREKSWPDDIRVPLRDMLLIDLEVVKSAAVMIREGQAAGCDFAVHVPVHFRCISSLACRAEFMRLLPLFADIHKYLVFCVVGAPDGAPEDLLADAVRSLRPYGIGVVLRAQKLNGEPRRWRRLGLSGISYEFVDESKSSPDLIQQVRQFGVDCTGVATALIGHAVSSRPMLLAAWSAGFTHISGSPIPEKIAEPRRAIRFRGSDIYS